MVKFACDSCGRGYSVAEELRGRAFKMKCKSCGHIIVVKPAAAPTAEAAMKPVARSAGEAIVRAAAPPVDEPIVRPAAFPADEATARLAAAPSVEVAQIAEPAPKPFSVPAAPSAPPETDLTSAGGEAGTEDQRPIASADALSSERSSVTTPAQQEPPSNGTQSPEAGYLGFLLGEYPGPHPKTTTFTAEPQPDEGEAAILEPLEASPPPPAPPAREAEPEVKDPFAGWIPEEDVSKPAAVNEETQADAEVTDPVATPTTASAIAAPPLSRDHRPIPKKGGIPKPLLYGVAAILVVAGVLGVAVLKGGSTASSSASQAGASAPGSPASPTQRVQLTQPELAAPDPQFLQSAGSGGTSHKPTPSQAENGLQGRPVESRADQPSGDLRPETAAPGVAAENPVAAGRPDRSKVDQIVAAHRKAFDECVTQASSRDPTLQQSRKKVTLVVTVVPSGDVTSAQMDDPKLDEPQLNACLRRAAKRMVFPSFGGGPLFVNVPLSFAR